MLHLFGFMVEQGAHPFVQILFGAVSVCRAMVMLGYFAATSCAKAAKASEPVTRSLTRCRRSRRRRYGDLDDAIGFRLGETLECGVQGLCAGHIDRGIA